eukprot:355690-Chlamydomonas_euryale.AAC.4
MAAVHPPGSGRAAKLQLHVALVQASTVASIVKLLWGELWENSSRRREKNETLVHQVHSAFGGHAES